MAVRLRRKRCGTPSRQPSWTPCRKWCASTWTGERYGPAPSRCRRCRKAALRGFARPRAAVEQCELCGLELPAEHAHLWEQDNRRLACACEACTVLFAGQDGARFRRVPRQVRYLADFRMSDEQWDALHIP